MKNLRLGEAAKRAVGTGANQIPDMTAFTSDLRWFKLPSGHIVQVFSVDVYSTDVEGTPAVYPIAFPYSLLAISAIWVDPTQTEAPTYKIIGGDRTLAKIKTSKAGKYGTMIIAIGK
ncbi:hypothetical protein N8S56_22685 [Enterobacter hormaechei subsp. hoffmannii]|uniref:hypothetical protein n=1 Tax=Enterobacter hormaechei TaxID=158836 RepID=UPI0028E64115|nr:hypothetical protein [Enterobacter hormaechei]EIX1733150.1 hypothetical protein [Cronobacter sakazakii]MCU2916313.1 hypothetical protein [Enterobacter hormaechei subsp. hoffmannii]HCJ6659870.1 hypothetical protein [Enterobacter hormaechei subsp. xiangfangensis]MCU2965589.1 hypothetical protein [Enterobacter hormaechei subsp. hoffmannii]WNS24077.1 hypothetical protein RRJ53_03405 [Enterobacter hormaechei]